MISKKFTSVTLILFLSFVLTLTLGVATSGAMIFQNSNFSMLDAGGGPVGGPNDVYGSWDETLNTSTSDTNFNMTLASPTEFFGNIWTAHNIRVFGPGTYTFDTGCSTAEIEAGTCGAGAFVGAPLTMTVDEGQIGAHMLFDWSASSNIDLVNVWDMNAMFDGGPPSSLSIIGICDPLGPVDEFILCAENHQSTVWTLVSTDDNGDGVPGVGFVDGPFLNFNGNFNLMSVPEPTSFFLIGSGLAGLLGMKRKKK